MKGPIIVLISFFGAILLFVAVIKVSNLLQNKLLTRSGIFRVLDKILVTISIIGILAALLWDFNYLRFSRKIEHRAWESIELDDFKGLKRPSDNLYGEEKFAFVSTSIRINKKRGGIDIASFFHPTKSYVYNRKLFADKLLTHEMCHFHITEYHARLIRKEIAERIVSGSKLHLNDIYQHFMDMEREMQSKYDYETAHGYVRGKQIEWEIEVKNLLASMSQHADTFVPYDEKN